MNKKNASYYFLQGGGKMGELFRATDWSTTSLGHPESWPQSLRTTVGILLNSKSPMFLWWSDELTCLYNDAYRPSLGNEGKHPSILGMPGKDAWPEIWHIIYPMISQVMEQGDSFWYEDLLVPIYRNGNIEDVYWTFSYSPVHNDAGTVEGVLVICAETTENVITSRKVEESDQRFRNTMKQAPVGITILRGEQYIVEMANDVYLQLVDKTETEFIGRPLFDSLPEVKEAVHSLLDNVLKTGIAYHGNELRVPMNRYGIHDVFYFDFIYYPLKEEESITGVIVVVTDVTEKVETRKKIEEDKRLYETITQNTPDLIYAFDLNYRFTYANEALLKMWGCNWEDAIGKGMLELGYEPWHAEMHEREIDQVISTKKSIRGEVSFPHAQMGVRMYDYIFAPVINEKGEVEAITGTTRDISDIKSAQEELKKSEEQFSTLADNMENLAWLANGDGWIYWYNKRWLEYTGLTLEEMKGWGWEKVHHPDHVERVLEFSKKIWQIPESFELTFPLRRHDGVYRWFLTRGYPVINEEGKIIKWIGTNTDITEQKKAEEQFKILADQAPMWVWLTDKAVKVLYANSELLKFVGVTHYSEFTGHIWEQKVHPDDIQMVHNAFGEAASLQQSFSLEFRVQNAINQLYEWFFVKGVPRLEEGEFTGFIGTGINISEQKLILAQLEYRTALMEAHNEASIDGILLVDTKGKILSYNHRFVEIWNMPQQIVGNNDDEAALVFAETQLANPEQFIERVNWLYKNPKEISIDELEFKDGKIVERHGYPVAAGDGSNFAWSWVFRDITEQRRSERTVKESEEKFRLLADSMPQHIWTSDTEGNLNYFNQSVFDYTGLTAEQVYKEGWLQIVHPDDRDKNIEVWLNAISTGNDFLFEHRFRRHDGEYRWQLSRAIPQRNSNGKIQMWVGTSTDIQEQKIREEKKDEFISIASHEMKTPLTTAKAYLQMLELLLDENDEEANLYAKKASQSVNRLNELIGELLDVSKIQLGKLNYNITTFDFNDMIDTTVENIQLTSTTHTIVKTGKVNEKVTGDKDRLQQVVINLLTNAIKYSPHAEKVYINVGQILDRINVSVIDTGIGIAQQSLDKVFEKYHRVEEHAVQFQGLGIGLFVSYEIIQRHHGKLWAESELGKGSTFNFTLPLSGA